MMIRRAANHLFHIFKVYVSIACIGALTTMAFGLIYAYPWIGALLFLALELMLLALYFLRKTALVIELGGVRLEFGKQQRGVQVFKH